MLIYEKNNKLNINFDNEISENPDLQIGKEDGKTEVLVDGQPSGGGGGSGVTILTLSKDSLWTYHCDKTVEEVIAAASSGLIGIRFDVEGSAPFIYPALLGDDYSLYWQPNNNYVYGGRNSESGGSDWNIPD